MRLIILIVLLGMLVVAASFADVPHIISYQGRLTDTKSGEPFTGYHKLEFGLYTSESGFDRVWSEMHPDVFLNNGLFNVMLGSVAPLALDFSEQYWLEVVVDGVPLEPRYELGASPYALGIADNAVTGEKIRTGAVTNSALANDVVFGEIYDEAFDRQFALTNRVPHLQFVGEGGAEVDFDSENHRITISVADDEGSKRAAWKSSGGFVYLKDSTNFVGIGTSTPAQKLEVVGNCAADTFFGDGSQLTGIGVNWDTLGAYPDTSIVYDTLEAYWDTTNQFSNFGQDSISWDTLSAYWDTTNSLGMKLLNESDSSIWMDSSSATGYWSVALGFNDTSSGKHSTVSGGYLNVASGRFATVGGGGCNIAKCISSTVSGGFGNEADSNWTTVSGGSGNTARFVGSTVGGGAGNYACGSGGLFVGFATISGGSNNTVIGRWSTVGGGLYNTVNGQYSTIPGGRGNSVIGYNSFVLGLFDTLTADSTILLGLRTIIHDSLKVEGIVRADTFFGAFSGSLSGLSLQSAYDGGGEIIMDTTKHNIRIRNNIGDELLYIDRKGATIGIGTNSPGTDYKLDVDGDIATDGDIIFDRTNKGTITTETLTDNRTWTFPDKSGKIMLDDFMADNCSPWYRKMDVDEEYVVYTGEFVDVLNPYCQEAFLGIAKGGCDNELWGTENKTHVNLGVDSETGNSIDNLVYCTVSGGVDNIANGNSATVGGGSTNIALHDYSTIGGGRNNTADSMGTTVSGGMYNYARGVGAIVCGGSNDTAYFPYSTVCGGLENKANEFLAFIGGGYNNIAGGYASTISGGESNFTQQSWSTISGGKNNRVTAWFSAIPGGRDNDVSGAYSFAFGNDVDVTESYRAVFFKDEDGKRGRLGVNTESPLYSLDVTGDGHFTGNLKIGDYTLPDIDGVDGQVLKTDGSGEISWQNDEITGGISGWLLTGNIGAGNFLGSTDAQPLSIRTNNIEKVRITTQGQIETYNTGHSVFIGEGAGANDDLTTNQNVFIGYQAGYSNTTGNENTASGTYALGSNTTGTENTANGHGALGCNTEGLSNTASGTYALYTNTIGYDNTASGYVALYSNTEGTHNTASGGLVLYSNTEGSYNTANGYCALFENTTGNENTASGFYALLDNTTGSNNIAIGYQAGANITTGSNNIIIGCNTDTPDPEGDYQLNIGNIIYGDLTAGAGKVGINNPEPTAALHCNGSMATSVEPLGPGSYDLEDAKYHSVFTEGAGVTLTLPSAVTYKGRRYYIRNIDEDETVTLDVVISGGNIDGSPPPLILSVRTGIIIQSDGSDWWIFGSHTTP